MVSSTYKHLNISEVRSHIETVYNLHPKAAESLLNSLSQTREPFTYDHLRNTMASLESLFGGRDNPDFSKLRGSVLTRFQ